MTQDFFDSLVPEWKGGSNMSLIWRQDSTPQLQVGPKVGVSGACLFAGGTSLTEDPSRRSKLLLNTCFLCPHPVFATLLGVVGWSRGIYASPIPYDARNRAVVRTGEGGEPDAGVGKCWVYIARNTVTRWEHHVHNLYIGRHRAGCASSGQESKAVLFAAQFPENVAVGVQLRAFARIKLVG